jgi:short-subunit dehydrogenase
MTKQTIVITGASSGFGLTLATQLHERGHIVIGTSRDPDKIRVPFKMLKLDISDDESVRSFGKELSEHASRIDVLINNAGYYLSGLAEEATIAQGKDQFETNFWGTIKVTNELLPSFRRQKSGKILTVGSLMGLLGFPNSAYYSASKHALEGYFKSLRFELHDFRIKVAMVEPTAFKTNILHGAVMAENKIGDYNGYRKKVEGFAKDLFDTAPEPTAVIETLLKLVEEKNPKFSNPVGKGTFLSLVIQLFAYTAFENTIMKKINTF